MKQQKEQQEIKEEDKFTQIYLATNCFGDPNKVYVGKEKSHQVKSRKGSHIRKFGEQIEFTFIDICGGWNRKQWLPLECFWIEQFRQWGFELQNKNKGGGGSEFCSKEHRQKISESNKGIIKNKGSKRSKETREKMSMVKIGMKFSKERNEKISNTKKGYMHREESKLLMRHPKSPIGKLNIQIAQENTRKPVLQYYKDGTFIKRWDSIQLATINLSIELGNKARSGTGISNCCNLKQKTSHGFIWKFDI